MVVESSGSGEGVWAELGTPRINPSFSGLLNGRATLWRSRAVQLGIFLSQWNP